jgi:hypothetical protein
MVKMFRVGVAFFLALICLTSPVFVSTVSPAWAVAAWSQVGSDIDGEAAYDQSGDSVSFNSDGTRVAIGAPYNDGAGTDAGHVRVYNLTGGAWVQVGSDINGEGADDGSGQSVSLSSDGSTVAIGAIYNDGAGTDAGHVRVYNLTGGAWVQVGSDINGEAASDRSGNSVSLSSDGSTVAIGANFNDGVGDNAGHVRVYRLTGGAWVQVGSDINGEAADDYSGNSVSLSSDGSRVAIGATGNDGVGDNAGHVRVYNLTGSAWVQVGGDINGEAAYDQSGYSVSLSSDGSTVAMGAVSNNGGASFAGHVRVFGLTSGAWVQVGGDINGEAARDYSGYAVSLSSNGCTVAIGAIGNAGGGSVAGHVGVYDASGCSGITSEPRSLKVKKKTAVSRTLVWAVPLSLNRGSITDYVIQYRVGGTTEWSTFADGTSTNRKVKVTGLTKRVKYQFQVAARTTGGDSPYSTATKAS